MCSNSSQLIQWPTTSVDVVVTSHFTWKEPGACLFVCLFVWLVGCLVGWLVVWFVCLFVCLVGCLFGLFEGDGRLPGLLLFFFWGGGEEDSAELKKTCIYSIDVIMLTGLGC